ncbi:hypothetical protein HGRIS_006618 [Hohenbuehelia grisea]|uniref:Maltose/galactoside acetyltransferase domain-containing protein n=1 Tax=Hohenbuehelia grisea TaxID=104357 RepID=A0ABR3J9I3_9AGAR
MSSNAARLAAIDAEYADILSTLTETQKALLGLPYMANEPALVRGRLKARRILLKYNHSEPSLYDPPDLNPAEKPKGIGGSDDAGGEPAPGVGSDERRKLLADLFEIDYEKLAHVEVEPPFYCDYGTNIKLEGSWYTNFNTVILDCAEVRIGTGVLFGPNVSIYSATHTAALPERQAGLERALPVSIGRDSWIGGGVSIMAGVNIGKGCTIGAGSVVTRDIPDFSVAVGSPAKVVKTLQGEERGSLQ